MKRVASLLLFVSIAFAGCYDVELDKFTGEPVYDTRSEYLQSNSALRADITKLKRELSEYKSVHEQNEALMVRIDELEAALEFQREVERPEKALLVRTAKLEAALDSQRVVIENLKNVYRLHEAAIEYQRVALESLLNLCRLYESKIESQRVAIENSKNIFGEFAGMYFLTSQANRNKTHVMN